MVESTEMKIFNEETSAKILNSVKNAAFSELIEQRVSRWDIASNVISIFFRLFAVLFNLNLAYEYHIRGEVFFFRMTMCFIFIPALISVILSITLWVKKIFRNFQLYFTNICRHHEDSKNEDDKARKKGWLSVFFCVIIFPYTLRWVMNGTCWLNRH